MSTRSAIVMKTDTGYAGVYCHSDGYPAGVGAVLNEHYQDTEKIKALIALGDLSYLEKNVEPRAEYRHKFEDRQTDDDGRKHVDPDATMAYHRDRGEDLNVTTGETAKAVAKRIDHQYLYVFENGDWTCNGEPLAKAVREDKQ